MKCFVFCTALERVFIVSFFAFVVTGQLRIWSISSEMKPQSRQWPDPPDWAAADATATLAHLRAGCERAAGYREVKPAGLLQKMEDITRAKAWRPWDVAKVCEVPELDAAEK